MTGQINLLTSTVKAALIDVTVYTYSASHSMWSDAVGAVVGTPGDLLGKTVTNTGVFDADDITFSAVTGPAVGAVIIYVDTGSSVSSPLIAYIDKNIVGNQLLITPNDGDITLQWPNTDNRIFAL